MQAEPLTEALPSRRPIAMRASRTVQALARFLAKRGVSANSVSIASIACALLAAIAMIAAGMRGGLLPFVVAALLVFARGICNLVDGLIAIENDGKSATGAFLNEAPDRIADVLLFTALGLAWNWSWMGLSAGLAVSTLCIGTAYLRALGKTLTGEDDFRGPLAKPHRIGVLIFGLLLTPFLPASWQPLGVTLAILFAGTLLTLATRTSHLLQTLRTKA